MELLLPLVLGFFACLFGGLYLLGVFRQRRPGEPPLDKGWIPWLGHALVFQRDPHKLLQKMREKHGDIFTIQVGGLYFTILLDPLSLEAFFKQGRDTFNSRMVANHVAKKVFGFVPVDDKISILNHKLLQGDALQDLTESVMSNLQNIMLNNLSSAQEQRKWTKDGLFKYCFNILFRTGFLTLFGNTASQTKGDKDKAKAQDRAKTEGLFNEFYKYDHLFPSLVYGVLSSNFQREAQRLNRFFRDALSLDTLRNKDNISGWILDIQQTLRNHGTSELMIERFMLCLLWASQGNMTAPAFWLLFFLMKEPEAMEALRREVDDVLKDSEQEVRPGGPLVHLTHDMLMKTPVLDSAIEETLRLITAPLLTRLVCQDTTLKMASGREFLLRKGDRIGTFPYMAVQTDPEIHPDPHTFKYDRFRSPDGTKKRDFYKGGQRVKYHSLPFGSGLPMCPGRFFATNQLKLFVFHMLVYFDFELVNPDENIPKFKIQRFGLGTLHPEREIHFQYSFKFLDNKKKKLNKC